MQTTRLLAGLEALASVVLCVFAGGLAKALSLSLSRPALGPALQALSPLGVLVLVYGARFRLSALPRLLLLPRLSRPAAAILLLHAAQAACALLWPLPAGAPASGDDGSGGRLACASAASVAWAPLFEELAFRVVAFYVALLRARGDLPFAVIASTALFGAMHVANVISSGGASLVAWLQVPAATAFGAAWALVFAASGSAAEVVALHAANNAAAMAFLGRAVRAGSAADCGAAMLLAPPELLASLALQAAVYAWAAHAAWLELARLADAGEVPARHALVYAPARDGDAADADRSRARGSAFRDGERALAQARAKAGLNDSDFTPRSQPPAQSIAEPGL
jgi:membrane protease YdiL (CAAX protease family)